MRELSVAEQRYQAVMAVSQVAEKVGVSRLAWMILMSRSWTSTRTRVPV